MNHRVFSSCIQKAFELIELPNCKRKHFSFILHKRKLVSIGWNNAWYTHPLAKKFGHRFESTHSELAAIKNLQYPVSFLDKCRVVNVRVNRHGLVLMSKPCPSCENMLKFFGVKEIWYSTNEGQMVQL